MTTTNAHGIVYGGEAINFSVERTARRKTVAISVGYDGVRVLAPTDMDDEQVLVIVHRRGRGSFGSRPDIGSLAEHRSRGSSLAVRLFTISGVHIG